jgi:hypothetical protein
MVRGIKIIGIVCSAAILLAIGWLMGYHYYNDVQPIKIEQSNIIKMGQMRASLLDQKKINDEFIALKNEMEVKSPTYVSLPSTFVYVRDRGNGYSIYKDDLGLYLVWKDDLFAQSVHIVYLGKERDR